MSIVNWMTSQKMDHSYQNRAKLAQQYGIQSYKGTAQQNTQLLGYLQKPKQATPVKPVVNAVKPIQPVKQPVAKPVQPVQPVQPPINQQQLQQMSIKALSGDKAAQEYLKKMGQNPLTGTSLWKGVDAKTLSGNALKQYMKDNPTAGITKTADMEQFERFNKLISSNKPMSNKQMQQYQALVQKWNLQDHTNPLVQQQMQLTKDKEMALKAQDSALNNNMANLDMNNFQMFQQLQQNMSERGMGDSGIAQDAALRMQMGANRDYQDAFIQSQQNKSDIQSQYTNQKGQIGLAIDQQKQQKLQFEQQQQLEQQKQVQAQDQFLTKQTGVIYANGKPLMHKGKPITTLEYQKLSETVRSNIAKENNIANKNQLDYLMNAQKNQMNFDLGMAKNQTNLLKIQANVETASAKLQLAYKRLDLDWTKASANIDKSKAELDIAARNAATKEQSNMIKGLSTQMSTIQKAIDTRVKAGQDPTPEQKAELQMIMQKLDAVLMGK